MIHARDEKIARGGPFRVVARNSARYLPNGNRSAVDVWKVYI